MDWKRIFEPVGLNWWIVAAGIGTNFLLTVVLFVLLALLRATGLDSAPYLLLACGGAFSIAFLTGYLCGRLAGERYTSYAFYPLAGYLLPLAPGVLIAGLPALLLAGFGFVGAWNAALLLQRRAARRRDAIYRSSAGSESAKKSSPDSHPATEKSPKEAAP
jgi:hypothetical protein